MERACKLLRDLKLPAGCRPDPEDLIRAAWARAVGGPIARHARVAGVRGRVLVVEVEDPLWQQNLALFRDDILKNLAAIAGPGLVNAMRIELGVPRIEPRRPVAAADEADGIRDPGLRRIYREARSRR